MAIVKRLYVNKNKSYKHALVFKHKRSSYHLRNFKWFFSKKGFHCNLQLALIGFQKYNGCMEFRIANYTLVTRWR